MKSALFPNLSIASLLVFAGMSGCGDTGNSAGNTDQTQLQPVCQNLTIQPCECSPGTRGVQTCQNGQWGVCTCGTPGTGGGPPLGTGGGGPGAICGDGIITPPEQCDGQNQGTSSCTTVTMGACSGGYLICTASCTFDTSACVCGGGGQGGSGATSGIGGAGGPIGGTTGQP